MLWSVLLPFLAALVAVPLVRRLGAGAAWLLAAVPTILFVRLLRALPIAPGEAVLESRPWVSSLGVELGFRLDGLSATFALLITGIGALVLVYAGEYLAHDRRLGRFLATLLAFMGSMLGVVLADDLITLFVFWELTSVTSYLLIGFDHERPGARDAALKALLVTGGGGLAVLAGLLLLGLVGGDLTAGGGFVGSLSALEAVDVRGHWAYPAILMLVVLGAATKSAQVPFHFWLPEAMAAPTPVSAYLHSATMVKAGVYLLARLHPQLGQTVEWEWLVGGLGLVTMLVAAGMALGQTDLKKILAYSTVAVLGILTMLIGVGTTYAIKTAVVFLVAHALYKAALFMVAGNVDHETGTRDVTTLGGLRRLMPWTAAAGLLAALSKAGAPPMFGFIGKELLYKAKLDLEVIGGWLVIAAVIANVALVATALLVSVKPFWGRSRPTPKEAHEAPFGMLLGPVVLAVTGVVVGLLPAPFEHALGSAMATAVAGRPVVMDLKLWHGLNVDALMVLGLSLVTLAAGTALYLVLRRRLAGAATVVSALGRVGPARVFDRAVDALPGGAARVTAMVPIGRLRFAILTSLIVAVGLAAAPLVMRTPLVVVDLGPTPEVHEVLLALLAATGALATVVLRSRLAGVASLGVTGLAIALLFVAYGAPDLAMTQIAVESLSVILLALVFAGLAPVVRRSGPAGRLRDAVVATAAGAVAAVTVVVTAGVRLDAEVARYYLESSVPLAYGRNVVNVILVDFRALDTMGEIVVVAVAGLGVAALLAAGRRRRASREEP
jgi:multicomponent Na+:H+ antiporter subunit A